jgi:hypothetical protein
MLFTVSHFTSKPISSMRSASSAGGAQEFCNCQRQDPRTSVSKRRTMLRALLPRTRYVTRFKFVFPCSRWSIKRPYRRKEPKIEMYANGKVPRRAERLLVHNTYRGRNHNLDATSKVPQLARFRNSAINTTLVEPTSGLALLYV